VLLSGSLAALANRSSKNVHEKGAARRWSRLAADGYAGGTAQHRYRGRTASGRVVPIRLC
jgi:hypothetical protein